jgi:hypothetical protein
MGYGLVFSAPLIFKKLAGGDVLISLIIANFAGALSIPLCYFTIETALFGRKRFMMVWYGIYAIALPLGYFTPSLTFDWQLIFWISIAYLVIDSTGNVIYPYTSEIYDTDLRGVALSVNAVYHRFAGIIMPFLFYELFPVSPELYIMILVIAAILAVMMLAIAPADKTGKGLDAKLFDFSSINAW